MTSAATPPNILVLMTDQQRFDALRCAGNAEIHTPNLDRLAAEGVRFESCYVQNPICSPSRASFATGLYPHAHGLWANGVDLPDDRVMLSRALADAGYDCGMVGKQHLGPCALGPEARRDDGYRVYRWSHDPINRAPENSFHQWLRAAHPAAWQSLDLDAQESPEAGNVAKGATPVDTLPVEAHYSRWIAEEAIAFIGEDRATSPSISWRTSSIRTIRSARRRRSGRSTTRTPSPVRTARRRSSPRSPPCRRSIT